MRVRSYPARTPMTLGIFRGGQTLAPQLTPVEFPARLVEGLAWDRLGLRLKPDKGSMVITAVRPGSAAERVGLEPGDLLQRINNLPVATADAFKDAVIAARTNKSVLLLVRRGRYGYYLTLPF